MPTRTFPSWLRAWADVGPMSAIANLARGLMVGGALARPAIETLIWGLAVLIILRRSRSGPTGAASEGAPAAPSERTRRTARWRGRVVASLWARPTRPRTDATPLSGPEPATNPNFLAMVACGVLGLLVLLGGLGYLYFSRST